MRNLAVRLLGAALCSIVLAGAHAPASAHESAPAMHPREAVQRIARLIRSDYLDAAKAARIAGELEQAADSGAFDALVDPLDLAAAITRRLEPHDRHFLVTWAPDAPSLPQATIAAFADEARANHGFVEARVLPGGVGYLKIDEFARIVGRSSPQQAAADAALAFVEQQPSLILDLRDNGGGSPDMVGYLVQHFVADPQQVASRFVARNGRVRPELSPVRAAQPPRTHAPLFILVSARTASSAEALAYTLQAAGRATVVGEPTWGAANPGSRQHTRDGFDVFISFETPINPITGSNWEGTGIRPDIAVPQEKALHVAHVRALEAEGAALPASSRRVLETLKAELAPAPPPAGLAGQYGEIAIDRRGDALFLRLGKRPERTVTPIDDSSFALAEDPAARFRIERDAAGRIDAIVRLLNGGASEFRFRKDAVLASAAR